MSTTFISGFTPSLSSADMLEAMLVQRQRRRLAERLTELVRESASGESKHHSLVVGPRGMGKTHLVSVVYYRVAGQTDLRAGMRIAWLGEEGESVSSFLDFLLRVLQAVIAEEDRRGALENTLPEGTAERFHALYTLSAAEAERAAGDLLSDVVEDRTLFVIVENLDNMLEGLELDGQHRLRAYIQEHPFWAILATSQSLSADIRLQTSPFYGFFRVTHLEEFSLEDAIDLLANIAEAKGDEPLAGMVRSARGRARIRAVRHLAKGNPRIYVIFADVLTVDGLDELVDATLRMIDGLTSYYQERMRSLSAQQRKIVEYLCGRGGAAPVKDIARYCFITPQTASSQLKQLKSVGYVVSESVGRESFYELREPLMRLWFEVKKNRGEPIRLLVEFLRSWKSKEDLENHLEGLDPNQVTERKYIAQALAMANSSLADPVVEACEQDLKMYSTAQDIVGVIQVAEELTEIRGSSRDWLTLGRAYFQKGSPGDAVMYADRALALDPNDTIAWTHKGGALIQLGRADEALASFERATGLDPTLADCWLGMAIALSMLDRDEEALSLIEKAAGLGADPIATWTAQGAALNNMERYTDAVSPLEKVIAQEPDDLNILIGCATAYMGAERPEDSLICLDKAVELSSRRAAILVARGFVLNVLRRHEEALSDFEEAITLNQNLENAWTGRAQTLDALGRTEEILASLDRAAELNPGNASTWYERGRRLYELDRLPEALVSLERATELDASQAESWRYQGAALGKLSRFSEALASFAKAIEHRSDWVLPRLEYARVLLEFDRNEEALEVIEQAIALDPDNGIPWLIKSQVFRLLGRPDDALLSIDRATELNPDWDGVWLSHGWQLAELGRHSEALVSYAKAIESNPSGSREWRYQAVSLSSLGRHDEAAQAFAKAVEFDPGSASVRFDYSVALFRADHFDEGALQFIAARGFAQDSEGMLARTLARIVQVLLSLLSDPKRLREEAEKVVRICEEQDALSFLGTAIVASAGKFDSMLVSGLAAEEWRDTWVGAVGGRTQLALALRLLDIAVRCYVTKDRRVLLELPTEERELIEPLLRSAGVLL